MTIRERMRRGGSLALIETRFAALLSVVAALQTIVLGGQNVHKVNDVTNVVTNPAASDFDTVAVVSQALITAYEAHRASTTHHLAADSTNTIGATYIGLPAKIYALVNDLKVQFNAHVVNVTSVHGAADNADVVATANATTKATTIALLNALRAAYELHRVKTAGSVHGAADATNAMAVAALTVSATWTEIAALADDFRAKYEAHRVLTAASVHAGADATDDVTETAVGTALTALVAHLNNLTAKLNAHFSEFGTSHALKDVSLLVTTTTAATLADAVAATNQALVGYQLHCSRAGQVVTIEGIDVPA